MTTDTAEVRKPDLAITRTFNAPRELVFELWSNEDHLVKWFGPRQFPVVSWKHDFRPGGRFEFVMQGPDGTPAPGSGEYLEITPGERIVALSQIVANGQVIFEVRQTHTFADGPDGTTTFTHEAVVVRDENFPGRAGMQQGWAETLDRLEEYLATLQ